MNADWEIEIGGNAPVIEADWPGFVDLHADPTRIREIAEAVSFRPLARLLGMINAVGSPFWTSKCDVWEPGPLTLACYVDVLPSEISVFADWHAAESFCRACVASINRAGPGPVIDEVDRLPPEDKQEITINMVVRAAIAGGREGFGVTVYMSAEASGVGESKADLAHAMDIFANALLDSSIPSDQRSTLK